MSAGPRTAAVAAGRSSAAPVRPGHVRVLADAVRQLSAARTIPAIQTVVRSTFELRLPHAG